MRSQEVKVDTVESLAPLLLLLVLVLLTKERPEQLPTCVVDRCRGNEKESHPASLVAACDAAAAACAFRCLLARSSTAPEAALLISRERLGRREEKQRKFFKKLM